MSKKLYLDCSSGVSGDMLLASLLCMADENILRDGLNKLGLGNEFELIVTEVVRVCAAKTVNVIKAQHNHEHEHSHEHSHEHNHEHEHEHNHENEHAHEHSHENEHSHEHSHEHEHEHSHEHEHEHEHSHERRHVCANGSNHSHHYHNHGRTYADIVDIISRSTLDNRTRDLALQIFDTLAVAEAQAHAVAKEQVHFHEVGAIDSIVDIVGFCILFNYLDISRVEISSINLGAGTVKCQHGILSVPVPAVMNMLQGFVVHARGNFERATPTGIAILKTVGATYANGASGKVITTGCGAGTFHSEDDTNTLSSVLLEQDEWLMPSSQTNCDVVIVATNIDNSTGEELGFLAQNLLEQGALDVWFSPIFMKKFRPAYKLEFMCSLSEKDKLIQLVFKFSGTIGVRVTAAERVVLPRHCETVMTSYGEVSIKTYGGNKTSSNCDCGTSTSGDCGKVNSRDSDSNISQATESKHKFEFESLAMVAKKCSCTLAEAQAKLIKELYDRKY